MDRTFLISTYINEGYSILNSTRIEDLLQLCNKIFNVYDSQGTILMCGNGGTAGILSNFSTDLNLHPFVSEDKTVAPTIRNKFKALNLCDNTSTITAITNDLGPENIFSEQIKYLGSRGDLLIAVSGSGTSPNIVSAIKQAINEQMDTVLITRNKNSVNLSNLTIVTDGRPSNFPGNQGKNSNNFYMEDCVCQISHIMTGLLKEKVQGGTRINV